MTPKQQEKIKRKIKNIKAALAADKKIWGGQYHDGRGLRYIPPQLYLELNDYTGGLRYFNWFKKNFSDDSGYAEFLFEWTIILFKTGKLKEAQKKAFETFCSNTNAINYYFGKQILKHNEFEDAKTETQDFADTKFCYSIKQDNLADFSEWLDKFVTSENFIQLSHKYLDIKKRLETKNDLETRNYLTQDERQLVNKL